MASTSMNSAISSGGASSSTEGRLSEFSLSTGAAVRVHGISTGSLTVSI
jgi:hypothetical protein